MTDTTDRPGVSRWRRLLRIAVRVMGGGAVLLVVATGIFLAAAWEAIGVGASGERLTRIEAAPNYRDGKFRNPEPLWNDYWGMVTGMMRASDHRTPRTQVPVERVGRERFDVPPMSGLRATWLGHSTVLLEIDGFRVLTDPVWGPRTSPVTWLGPSRWYPPPLPLEELPALDAIVISHDHYDHLDHQTIDSLRQLDVTWIVPLGVGANLEYWDIPEDRIVELNWGDQHTLGNPDGATLEIHATEARHASGRTLWDLDETLWVGYALLGAEHRVYFSGDTGLFKRMRDIGARFGPFDLTMIEVGTYDKAWPDWHIGPEQAIEAHQWLRGEVFLPIHWGLFDLANHSWTEPIERTVVAAAEAGVVMGSPRPGGSVEPRLLLEAAVDDPVAGVERWWPDIPWQTAAEHPVVSTQVDSRR